MKTKTIIPAQPNWFVADIFFDENEKRTAQLDPVIAWIVERSDGQWDVEEITPLCLGLYIHGLNGIVKPDGSVFVEIDLEYQNIEDFIEDTARREEEYHAARKLKEKSK